MLKKHIIVDNLKITYYRSDILNHKNTLIFLHGWGSQAIHFMNILKRCNNFIAFDLPGFGASERPKETWGLIEYSKFLKKFLKKLNIDNPILIGHSFGGSIIIKFCSLKLAKIKKIILIDSAGLRLGGVKIKVYKYLTKILKIPFLLPGLKKFKNSIRKKYYKAIDSTDYINLKNIKDIYLKIIHDDLMPDLKKIESKTVLIWGSNDESTPLKNAQIMHNNIVNSKLYVIKNAGHFPFIDNEREFNSIFTKEIG